MKKLNYLLVVGLALTIGSCSEKDIIEQKVNEPNSTITILPRQAQDLGEHDLLGWGYDPTMGYLDSVAYDKMQVIDVDRLWEEQSGDFFRGNPNTALAYIIAGSNAAAWTSKLSSKFTDSHAVNAVTTSISQDFSANNTISSKYSYATYVYRRYLQREKLYHSIEVLRDYLTPTFINNVNTLSANQIINNYGTHVYTDISIGGKLQIDYRSLVNSSNKERSVNSGVSAASDKITTAGASNSVGFSYKDENKNIVCNFYTMGGNVTISGNITDTTHPSIKDEIKAWGNSITLDNSEIVEIGDKSLIPIYEFVEDPAKKEALKSAVEDYLNSRTFNMVNGSILFGFSLNKTTDRILPLDYNGDGIMDIICYSPGYQVIYINAGLLDGTFYNALAGHGIGNYDLRSTSDMVNILDYNGDGKDDLMCYRPGSKTVYISKSNGDGTFTTVYSSNTGISGYDFSSSNDRAITLDYNGDGKDDLMCFRPGSNTVYVLKSNGDGTFTTTYSSNTAGIGGYSLASKDDRIISFDYNGDGKDDLMCYRPGSKYVWILKSNGTGTFNAVSSSSNGLSGYTFANNSDRAIALDYNGDKYDDILCFRPGYGYTHMLKSNGDGTFSSVIQNTNGIAGYNLTNTNDKIISIDYNKDTYSDLILYRPGSGIAFSVSCNESGDYTKDYPY